MVGGGDSSCSRRGWLFEEAGEVSMVGDGSFGLKAESWLVCSLCHWISRWGLRKMKS